MTNWLYGSKVTIRPSIEELDHKAQIENLCFQIRALTDTAITIDEELSNIIKGLYDYISTNYNTVESGPTIEIMTKHHLNQNNHELFECLRQNYKVFKFSAESSFWRAIRVMNKYLKIKRRGLEQ